MVRPPEAFLIRENAARARRDGKAFTFVCLAEYTGLGGVVMKTLRLGSVGPDVEAAQLALTRAGFPAAVDGIYGARTAAAARDFQRASSLEPDGIVGKATWRRLTDYLRGYVLYTVKNGDTYYKLAERYGTSAGMIETANPQLEAERLPVGAQLVIPLGFSLVPENVRFTSELTGFICEGLRARYPFVASRSYGVSALGRRLRLLTIGEGGKEAFYNAAHHANEWITVPVLLKFAEQYAAAVADGGEIFGYGARELFERVTLYIAPMVNPDGVDLVTGAIAAGDAGFDGAKKIAEGFPDVAFPKGWKANIEGTDLNLNYPAEWERAREIKYAQGFTRPAPRDFVGTSALSARESRAVYNLTREHDFALTLSYHSQGEIIYWKFLDYLPPRSLEIGRRLSEVSGYLLEETPYASGFAGYKDWFIQRYNRPGYTIEVGRGRSPLPLSQFDGIYRDNLGILALCMALI